MATKKEMKTTVENFFWSNLITEEAKKDFLELYPNQEEFFETIWDTFCGQAAKQMLTSH
jgi:hypothetical protein